MLNKVKNSFAPDYAVHPGKILEETLRARQIKKNEFAERCGLSAKTVSLMIAGKAPVTSDVALHFERVLGISSNIWNNLNSAYSLFMAKQHEQKELERQKAWADNFPLKELYKRNILSRNQVTADTVGQLLNYFGVGSITAWEERFNKLSVAFRQSSSFKSSPYSIFAWLQIGERIAERMECSPYDANLFKSSLENIRSLTSKKVDEFCLQMINLCCTSGVTLVFVSELPGMHLSGATRWLNKDKALIILSLRHKSDDRFWFSFFHEAGHIVLHGKKDVFIDEPNVVGNKEISEEEADKFASEILINKKDYDCFVSNDNFTRNSIINFADQQGIAPGIIVGRLQHDGLIKYNNLNNLKRKFVLVEHRN